MKEIETAVEKVGVSDDAVRKELGKASARFAVIAQKKSHSLTTSGLSRTAAGTTAKGVERGKIVTLANRHRRLLQCHLVGLRWGLNHFEALGVVGQHLGCERLDRGIFGCDHQAGKLDLERVRGADLFDELRFSRRLGRGYRCEDCKRRCAYNNNLIVCLFVNCLV